MRRFRYVFVLLLLICSMKIQGQQLINASIDDKGNLHFTASENSSRQDFDFLTGDRVSNNKRLVKRLQNSNEWITSEAVVNNRTFLHGISNLDVSTTIRNGVPFETLSLQIFNPRTRLWSLYWIDGNTGAVDPPVTGSFEGSIGTFYGRIVWHGTPVLVMYQWDKTNPLQPGWSQSYSTDDGKTWELNMVNIIRKVDDKPKVFAPGIISTDSSEFGSAFSPDGNSFYFARTSNKRSNIFFSRRTQDGWSVPVHAEFSNPNYSDADPAFSPDGSLYFISARPSSNMDTTNDYDIWKVVQSSAGWAQPINVTELNSPENELYVSFTSKGDVCFASARKGGYGEEDIYISKSAGNKFLSPVNAGPSVNSGKSEYDPFINADGSAIIFTSSGRDDSLGKGDLYWTARAHGEWMTAVHLDHVVNTAARDYCPYVTRDGKMFFYSTQGDIKSIPMSNLPLQLQTLFRR
jgi:Tol biopolymer transport system component